MTARERFKRGSLFLAAVCWLLLFQLIDSHLRAQSDNDPRQEAAAATFSLIGSMDADLASLGMVVGAAYDQESGRLALIGNGEHLECSPTRQQFAVALRYAFRDSAYYNFLSIDPLPDNPTSPYMTIRMNQDIRDTDFGWVMFEADRKLKCLSMGEDNYFGIADQSGITGFANIPEMTLQKGDVKDQNELWSRFWFYPTDCVVDTCREALFIRRAQIRIKTQTMKWEQGKLIPADGLVDETSEKFAAMVNAHFDQLADETPVFRQLEQLLRLLLVGDWIRNQNIPVNLDWVHACAATPFRMPRLTPAITVTNERRITDDKGITIQTWQIYGGVDLDYAPVMTEHPSERTPWQPPHAVGKTESEFSRFTSDGQSYTAASFSPLLFETTASAVTSVTQLTLPNGKPFTVSKRKTGTPNPHLQISQDSQMALPLLPSYYPQGHQGQIEYLRTSDPAQGEIVIKHYQLYDQDGRLLGIFKEHDVDPLNGRIQVRAEDPHSDWVLYPEAQGAVWAQSRDGRLWVFENQYGLPIGERVDDQFIRYHFSQQGVLEKATVENTADEISFIHGENGANIIAANTSQGQQVDMILPEPISSITLSAFNEIGQSFSVTADPRSGNVYDAKTELPGGLDYLPRHAAELASIQKYSSPTQTAAGFIQDGGMTMMVCGNSVLPFQFTQAEINRHLALFAANPKRTAAFSSLFDRVLEGMPADRPLVLKWDDLRTQNSMGLLFGKFLQHPIYTTTDLTRATNNLKQMDKTIDKVQLFLMEETLQEKTEIVDMFKGRNQEESNLAFVIGHDTPDFYEHLDQIAEKLRGKAVVLFKCGESTSREMTAQQAENLLQKHGCHAVKCFDHIIHINQVEKIINAVQNQFEQNGKSAIPQLLQESIRQAAESDPQYRNEYDQINASSWHVESLCQDPAAPRKG